MKTATLALAESHIRDSSVSTTTIAKLVNVSPSSLSAAMRDITYLGSEKEAEILTVAVKVSKFQRALEPLVVRDWESLKVLLDSGVEPDAVRLLVNKIFGKE